MTREPVIQLQQATRDFRRGDTVIHAVDAVTLGVYPCCSEG